MALLARRKGMWSLPCATYWEVTGTARANVPDALCQPTEIHTHVIGKGLVCRAPIGMALLARRIVMLSMPCATYQKVTGTARANVPDALRKPTDICTHVIGKGLVCRACNLLVGCALGRSVITENRLIVTFGARKVFNKLQ